MTPKKLRIFSKWRDEAIKDAIKWAERAAALKADGKTSSAHNAMKASEYLHWLKKNMTREGLAEMIPGCGFDGPRIP